MVCKIAKQQTAAKKSSLNLLLRHLNGLFVIVCTAGGTATTERGNKSQGAFLPAFGRHSLSRYSDFQPSLCVLFSGNAE